MSATTHARAILTIMALMFIAIMAIRGCGPDDAFAREADPPRPPQHQGGGGQQAPTANYSTSSNSSPAQPVTPTATVALPTATDWPTLTPAPTEAPRCSVTVYWLVAAGRSVNLYQRPAGTFGVWDWFLSIDGDFPATGIPLDSGIEVLADVPGPTNTPWPTLEPDTPTPDASATHLPTQTPWVIVVTATPEPTGTAPPTATARPLAPVLLPVVVRPRVRR